MYAVKTYMFHALQGYIHTLLEISFKLYLKSLS